MTWEAIDKMILIGLERFYGSLRCSRKLCSWDVSSLNQIHEFQFYIPFRVIQRRDQLRFREEFVSGLPLIYGESLIAVSRLQGMAGILISAANSEDADGWGSQIHAAESLFYVLQRPGFRGGVRPGRKKSRCSPSTRAQGRLCKF